MDPCSHHMDSDHLDSEADLDSERCECADQGVSESEISVLRVCILYSGFWILTVRIQNPDPECGVQTAAPALQACTL